MGKKSGEIIPEIDLMADILYKDFKTTFLKMHQELKKDVKNVKKIMYE